MSKKERFLAILKSSPCLEVDTEDVVESGEGDDSDMKEILCGMRMVVWGVGVMARLTGYSTQIQYVVINMSGHLCWSDCHSRKTQRPRPTHSRRHDILCI